MPLSDVLKDLDPKLSDALQRTAQALREEFDDKLARLTGAEPSEPELPVPEDLRPEPTVAADLLDPLEELKHAIRAVDSCRSQSEILKALVAGCSRFASRVAIFLVRGSDAFGWGGHGFDIPDDDLKRFQLTIEPESSWAKLVSGSGSLALSGEDCVELCELLAVPTPQVGVLLPFVLGNQTAAAIYCDRLEEDDPLRISALQILTFVASQVLENLPVRDREGTATLRLSGAEMDAGAIAAAEAPEVQEAAPEEVTAPPEMPEPEEAYEEAPEPEETYEEAPQPEETYEEAPEPEPVYEEASESQYMETAGADTGVEPLEGTEPVLESMATEAIAAPPPVAELGSPEPTPATGSTEVAPPADVKGPGWAFSAAAGDVAADEGADHEEARRLARLLVTEIKLYNEEQVEQGRIKGNVYSVLREDIDRSRQIYEDRIEDEIRETKDYFLEACVRILAGGDPSILGV